MCVKLNGNGIRLDGIRGMDAAARSAGKMLLKLQGKIILRSGALKRVPAEVGGGRYGRRGGLEGFFWRCGMHGGD